MLKNKFFLAFVAGLFLLGVAAAISIGKPEHNTFWFWTMLVVAVKGAEVLGVGLIVWVLFFGGGKRLIKFLLSTKDFLLKKPSIAKELARGLAGDLKVVGLGLSIASIFVKDPQGYVVLLIGLIIMGIGSWISVRIRNKI